MKKLFWVAMFGLLAILYNPMHGGATKFYYDESGTLGSRSATDGETVLQVRDDVWVSPSNFPGFVSGLTAVISQDTDYALLWDYSDNGTLKKVVLSELRGSSTAWDDIGNPDANDTINLADYVIQLQLGASGDLRFGDGGGNYTKFGPFGSITLHGSASFTGDITGDASGSSGSCTGNSVTATALATARNIGGVSFDGSAAIVPTTIVVADTTDATCYVGLWESATGSSITKNRCRNVLQCNVR